jgi:acyl-CoA synthetase (AMP-forming)/AMP-acid ligase II/thioesterase domain-containing protein/acyl carrier protein
MSATSAAPHSPVAAARAETGIANLLLRAAQHHPDSGAYLVSGVSGEAEYLSYSALLEEARRILGGLQTRGLRKHSKVALVLERPRDFMPAFWACVLGGYIPCPLARTGGDAQRWERHVAYIHTLLNGPVFIGAGRLVNELPAMVKSVSLEELRGGLPFLGERAAVDPAQTAVLMLTSGSTGSSKAVELTHGNILASMAAKAEACQWNEADVAFNWVGFDHVAALLKIHMIALYVGAKQFHVEPVEVLADPLQFLRLIDRHGISITFTPNFLLGQINAALEAATAGQGSDALKLDLSRLRRIIIGGEANVVKTGLRFLELLAPKGLSATALFPVYGLTETCAGIVYSNDFPQKDVDREFGAAGKPVRGLDLRIADDGDRALADGQSGEVQVRGPMVFRGYYNNEEATRAAFTADGWFRTGDLGCLEQGRLSIVARIKDSIIVNGVNYFGHELEAQLQQLEGIERSFVAAFPSRPKGADTEQLVVTFATSLQDDEQALYQLVVAIRNTTIMLWGFRPTLILPLPKSAFPKTSLGKIQRSLIRQRLEAGSFKVEAEHIARVVSQQLGPHAPPEGPLEEAVAQIYCSILGVDPSALSATVNFFDLGGTSLDILKLTQALERRCGAKLSTLAILQNPTVRQLAARIQSGSQPGSSRYNPIVPLQSSGKKTPLFCVHPGNSEVLVLVNLAKYFLHDRPFYAFRPPGFQAGETCFETLDEMISTYVEALLARQPRGPYAIAGYSMGALVAFEIAKELESRGHQLGFLGLIDHGPNTQVESMSFTELATVLAWVLGLIDLPSLHRLRGEIPEAPSSIETCEYILKSASSRRFAELDLDLQKFFTWARVAHNTEQLIYARVTRGKVSCLTAFCSSGTWEVGDWAAQLRSWNAYTEQPARVIDVAGDHYTLMLPKYVAAFQSQLREEIDLGMRGR